MTTNDTALLLGVIALCVTAAPVGLLLAWMDRQKQERDRRQDVTMQTACAEALDALAADARLEILELEISGDACRMTARNLPVRWVSHTIGRS